jgi:predicted metal-dependent phosphoesterase TrpH
VEKAAALGLSAIALTDHATLSGIPEAAGAAAHLPIELVPGVELSVDHDGVKIHMLAYFIEPEPGPLQDRLEALRRGRDVRNPRIVERLNELGYPITMDDVLAQTRGDAVGRPHIADALVAAGLVRDRKEAFTQLLADGKPAYVERTRLTAVEAITLTTASGGVTSIAHPYSTGLDAAALRALVTELAGVGLGGVEAYYSEHSVFTRVQLAEMATELGLIATGGSDYHGTGKPHLSIGVGTGDLVVPDEVFTELLERRP